MSIDTKKIREEAQAEIDKEMNDKAKNALKLQMRVVANAESVVRAEKLKLADLEAQIADGTLR